MPKSNPQGDPLSQSKRLKQSAQAPNAVKKRMTPAEQRRRFIEAARAAGCSEDEAEFDANLARIVKPKAETTS